MADDSFDTEDLIEGVEVEAKRAGGRDGKGALPEDVWETYSAFANTDGGLILLGVSEWKDQLEPTGIEEPERVLEDFLAQINNPKIVSRNILTGDSITRHPAENGRWVIAIQVPRASRRQRPVYIGTDPMNGTYKRHHSSDIRATGDEVMEMLDGQTGSVD